MQKIKVVLSISLIASSAFPVHTVLASSHITRSQGNSSIYKGSKTESYQIAGGIRVTSLLEEAYLVGMRWVRNIKPVEPEGELSKIINLKGGELQEPSGILPKKPEASGILSKKPKTEEEVEKLEIAFRERYKIQDADTSPDSIFSKLAKNQTALENFKLEKNNIRVWKKSQVEVNDEELKKVVDTMFLNDVDCRGILSCLIIAERVQGITNGSFRKLGLQIKPILARKVELNPPDGPAARKLINDLQGALSGKWN